MSRKKRVLFRQISVRGGVVVKVGTSGHGLSVTVRILFFSFIGFLLALLSLQQFQNTHYGGKLSACPVMDSYRAF